MDQYLEKAHALIKAAFPDPRIQITEDLIKAVVSQLPEDAQKSLVGEVLDKVVPVPAFEKDDEAVLDYWKVRATHHRPGITRFTTALPMVRVLVPETKHDIVTQFGIVYAGDSLRWTRTQVANRVADGLTILAVKHAKMRPGYSKECALASRAKIARVFRVTPARMFGARFAAVSVDILCDEHGNAVSYRLEAGMATGEPMIDFVSPINTFIEPRRAWYEPTPFSTDRQCYSGKLEVNGSLPVSLEICKYPYMPLENLINEESTKLPAEVLVTARFSGISEHTKATWPSLLTAQAALRVAYIARKLNRSIPDIPDFLRDVLADIAQTQLEWDVK